MLGAATGVALGSDSATGSARAIAIARSVQRAYLKVRAYTFTQTGRPVHNVIDATFEFDDDGRFVRHQDTFDLWRWSRMALGAKGAALGWTRAAKKAIRSQARKSLDAWMARASPAPAP